MNAPRLKHVGPACCAIGLVVGALAILVAGSVIAAVETGPALAFSSQLAQTWAGKLLGIKPGVRKVCSTFGLPVWR